MTESSTLGKESDEIPTKYKYTARSYMGFSSWNVSNCTYSLVLLNTGYNQISKLEIISMLNVLSQSIEQFYHNTNSCTPKYNPKIYLGTALQTIAIYWIFDRSYQSSTTANHDESITQKQVANKNL